jgi:hypothetical protein
MVLAAAAVVDMAIQGGLAMTVRWAPSAALAGFAGWAVFWSPDITVDDAGPQVRNILRTWVIPWSAIRLIDTKYSLTLVTTGRRITAFAAPAPGRLTVRRAVRSDVEHLPASTYGPGRSVRPGDLPSAPSGQIAIVLRERWEAERDAGHLDAPDAVPHVRWHRTTAVTLAVLAALALACGILGS